MSKKARQARKSRQLRVLRSWLDLPQETQKEKCEDYDDYEDFEDFDSYEDYKSAISDDDEYADYDDYAEYDYDGDVDVDVDSEDEEEAPLENYAERSRAAIARTFTVGSCYQVVSNKSIIKRLKAGGKYVLQAISTGNNDPEVGYTFRYLGKQGIHHMFREICGGWGRTYTDAQLVGKEVIEVSENDVRAANRLLMRTEFKF